MAKSFTYYEIKRLKFTPSHVDLLPLIMLSKFPFFPYFSSTVLLIAMFQKIDEYNWDKN